MHKGDNVLPMSVCSVVRLLAKQTYNLINRWKHFNETLKKIMGNAFTTDFLLESDRFKMSHLSEPAKLVITASFIDIKLDLSVVGLNLNTYSKNSQITQESCLKLSHKSPV